MAWIAWSWDLGGKSYNPGRGLQKREKGITNFDGILVKKNNTTRILGSKDKHRARSSMRKGTILIVHCGRKF